MSLSWEKAGYGGSIRKSGGGKLDVPGLKGNKGILPGGDSVPKSSISRPSSPIDVPGQKGNKGITLGGKPVSKAPKD